MLSYPASIPLSTRSLNHLAAETRRWLLAVHGQNRTVTAAQNGSPAGVLDIPAPVHTYTSSAFSRASSGQSPTTPCSSR